MPSLGLNQASLPTWVFAAAYLTIAPALTLGYKYCFSFLGGQGFHYPMTTVLALLVMEYSIAAILTARQRRHNYAGIPQEITSETADRKIYGFPADSVAAAIVGVCLSAEIAFSNMSLLTLSVSFHTMLKASTPCYVLLFSTLLGIEAPSGRLALVVAVIALGVALSSFGEINFAMTGFVFINLASAAGGLRWSISHRYLHGTPSEDGPLDLLYRSLPWAVAVLPPFCAYFEAGPMVAQVAAASSSLALLVEVFGLVLAFASGGFAMILVELRLVDRLSALTFAVLAIFKEILVVLLSVAIYHESLTPLNGAGFAVTLGGILSFRALRVAAAADDPPAVGSPLSAVERICAGGGSPEGIAGAVKTSPGAFSGLLA